MYLIIYVSKTAFYSHEFWFFLNTFLGLKVLFLFSKFFSPKIFFLSDGFDAAVKRKIFLIHFMMGAPAALPWFPHLPMLMHRSPRMLPGLESAGLVSPSIILASFTMFWPSQTWNTQEAAVSWWGSRLDRVQTDGTSLESAEMSK